jgi:hypothetical protein
LVFVLEKWVLSIVVLIGKWVQTTSTLFNALDIMREVKRQTNRHCAGYGVEPTVSFGFCKESKIPRPLACADTQHVLSLLVNASGSGTRYSCFEIYTTFVDLFVLLTSHEVRLFQHTAAVK